MRIRITSTQIVMLLVLAGAAFSGATVRAQTINRPSIQINLRTHLKYYRNGQEDQDMWSWSPRIKYRVVGPIAAGSQLSVEFTPPSGKPWIKFDSGSTLPP